ncbi:hypothetical protein K9L16_01885 [Candidatus Pacearchaeota archaeon]|nr:hypothetical protein [Candidatus Pacearchaeota archaeon]
MCDYCGKYKPTKPEKIKLLSMNFLLYETIKEGEIQELVANQVREIIDKENRDMNYGNKPKSLLGKFKGILFSSQKL